MESEAEGTESEGPQVWPRGNSTVLLGLRKKPPPAPHPPPPSLLFTSLLSEAPFHHQEEGVSSTRQLPGLFQAYPTTLHFTLALGRFLCSSYGARTETAGPLCCSVLELQ